MSDSWIEISSKNSDESNLVPMNVPCTSENTHFGTFFEIFEDLITY